MSTEDTPTRLVGLIGEQAAAIAEWAIVFESLRANHALAIELMTDEQVAQLIGHPDYDPEGGLARLSTSNRRMENAMQALIDTLSELT